MNAFARVLVFFVASFALFISPAALADQQPSHVIKEINWHEVNKADLPKDSLIVRESKGGDVFDALKVSASPEHSPQTIKLLSIEKPEIKTSIYRLYGLVKYDEVAGSGYLETMNFFPDGSAFFSRTLGKSGGAAPLSGSSDWREFSLPFNTLNPKLFPVKIDFDLVLPAGGSVTIGQVRLADAGPQSAAATARQWVSETAAIRLGAYGGAAIGILGAILGTLAGFGCAKTLVLSLSRVLVGAGIILILLGCYGIFQSQAYAIWYPLILSGVILSTVFYFNYQPMKRRYEQMELRKMAAMDRS